MREIKFRAWYHGDPDPTGLDEYKDSEKPQMLYNVQNVYDGAGDEIDPNGVIGWASTMQSLIDSEYYIFTLMEYTNIKDKNGVGIWEGDIVTDGMQTFAAEIGEQFIEGDFGEEIIYYGCNILLGGGYPTAVRNEYEVIGNIYEHPHLLEVSIDE